MRWWDAAGCQYRKYYGFCPGGQKLFRQLSFKFDILYGLNDVCLIKELSYLYNSIWTSQLEKSGNPDFGKPKSEKNGVMEYWRNEILKSESHQSITPFH